MKFGRGRQGTSSILLYVALGVDQPATCAFFVKLFENDEQDCIWRKTASTNEENQSGEGLVCRVTMYAREWKKTPDQNNEKPYNTVPFTSDEIIILLLLGAKPIKHNQLMKPEDLLCPPSNVGNHHVVMCLASIVKCEIRMLVWGLTCKSAWNGMLSHQKPKTRHNGHGSKVHLYSALIAESQKDLLWPYYHGTKYALNCGLTMTSTHVENSVGTFAFSEAILTGMWEDNAATRLLKDNSKV